MGSNPTRSKRICEGESMKFRNDVNPEDYMLMTGEHIWYVIAYSECKPLEPFVVEVLNTDRYGWNQGIQYDVKGSESFLSEWPKTWKWAIWKGEEDESIK